MSDNIRIVATLRPFRLVLINNFPRRSAEAIPHTFGTNPRQSLCNLYCRISKFRKINFFLKKPGKMVSLVLSRIASSERPCAGNSARIGHKYFLFRPFFLEIREPCGRCRNLFDHGQLQDIRTNNLGNSRDGLVNYKLYTEGLLTYRIFFRKFIRNWNFY